MGNRKPEVVDCIVSSFSSSFTNSIVIIIKKKGSFSTTVDMRQKTCIATGVFFVVNCKLSSFDLSLSRLIER